MGSLRLPKRGPIYADTQAVIYSVEKHPTYAPLLAPLWRGAAEGSIEVIASELCALEALVHPIRHRDAARIEAYETLFREGGIRLIPIDGAILREGARLRAEHTALRTPDAIHLATALGAGAGLFLTNDFALRGVPGLEIAALAEILQA